LLKDFEFIIQNLSSTPKPTITYYNVIQNKITDVQIEMSLNEKDQDKSFELAGKLIGGNLEYDEKKLIYKEQIELFLGINFKLENTKYIDKRILRCTKVFPNSPAENSKIIEKFDFILECVNFEYTNLDEFILNVRHIFKTKQNPKFEVVLFNV